MFLLSERGSTSFDVRAEDEPPTFRARVTVGAQHSCSACRWTAQPCRHARWVLVKLFGLPIDSSLLSRPGVTERELSALLNARPRQQAAHARLRQQAARADRAAPGLDPQSTAWLLSLSGEEAASLLRGPPQVLAAPPRRKSLEAQECCPICMEEMDDDILAASRTDNELVWCKVSCGRSMHARCLAAWATHNPAPTVKCPLCRAEWPFGPAAERAALEQDKAELERVRYGLLRQGLGEVVARASGLEAQGQASREGGAEDAAPPSSAALRWFQRQQEGRQSHSREGAQSGAEAVAAVHAPVRTHSLGAANAQAYRPLLPANLTRIEPAFAGASLPGSSIVRFHRAPGFAPSALATALPVIGDARLLHGRNANSRRRERYMPSSALSGVS